MSAALKRNLETEKLSRKPPLGEKRPRPRLVWENPTLSADKQKGKPKVKPDASYGRVLYNYFRYYDPRTGRYITADPIGLNGGINTYTYALNNPLYWIDPYGLDITVSFNPNAAAGFGHVGQGVNTPNTVGQRPQQGASSIRMGMGLNVPGEISPDPAAPSSVTIPTTPEQDRQAQQCIDTRTKQKQDYNLYNNNCTLFVRQCLGAAGISTPDTIFPRTLFNNLQQRFGGNP